MCPGAEVPAPRMEPPWVLPRRAAPIDEHSLDDGFPARGDYQP
jgi:hypothetical protein